MTKIPRQYFWDPTHSEWVRTTELVLDELRQVAEARKKSWQNDWFPWVWARFNRMHDELYLEFRRLGTSIVRTSKLRPGEVQVAPSEITVRLYPDHPYFWKKKETDTHGQSDRQYQR